MVKQLLSASWTQVLINAVTVQVKYYSTSVESRCGAVG
jgi:hypothetical protein